MKKSILPLVMVLTILLSSCTSLAANQNNNSVSVGAWTSEGGAYKQTAYDVPEGVMSVFSYGSEVYGITSTADNSGSINLEVFHNSDVIYAPGGTWISCAAVVPEGIWILESFYADEPATSSLKLISSSGEVIKTLPLNEEMVKGVFSMLYSSGEFYLYTGDDVVVLSDNGEKLASHKLPNSSRASLIKGNDGKAYSVCYFDDRVEVSSVDETAIQSVLTLQTPDIKVFVGNEEFCFIMSNSEGLFGLNVDGAKSPILIWKDCGIPVTDLEKVVALPAGKYLCLDVGGVSLLSPVDPSELVKKGELVLALVGDANAVKVAVADFNRENSQYTVIVKDYSEDGAYDTKTAITRLNTDIISGKCPDLILFSELSPFAYINKGYLLDLNKFLDNDTEIKREEIAILKQLKVGDGVFYLCNMFNIKTQAALYSEFGNATGWTLDKYLEIEKSRPSNAGTLYNTTKTQFLRRLSARYLRTAVNWETGKCDLDNDVFLSILEASKRIKENPEPEKKSEMDFTYPSVRVTNGTLVAVTTWVDSIGKLALEEKMAKCRLSYIGLPTVDGSCGSDIYVSAPVGICSQTKFPEACWDFLKFMLKDVETENSGRLPVYMPYLQKQIEKAKLEAPPGGVKMTDEDAQRFFALLNAIDNVAIYDETILGIIDEEASVFFAGDKTAKETAAIIQSRVQLYVSEQFS